MDNFTFHNPTKILFGQGQIANIAAQIPTSHKVLITYGGGSIKKNGVYDQVIAALKDHAVVEFGGIEANPDFDTLMKAVDLIKTEEVDYILAVGGGSIIDGTKFISAAAKFSGDPWTILSEQAQIDKAVPFGTVLTLPATGSEMNSGAVVSRRATGDKINFGSPLLSPQFSVLDPTTTFSVSPRQTANGVVDAFTHTMEQYLTYPADNPFNDRVAEGLLLTLIEEGPKVMANPNDYTARANIMWCACWALNGLLRCGVPEDWATHMIGHEITAAHGLDHAQTLAIVLPTVMEYKRESKQAKLLQYAERIWNIKSGSESERIDSAISKTRQFFESLNVPTFFKDYDINEPAFDLMMEKLKEHGRLALGEHRDITLEDSRKILEACA